MTTPNNQRTRRIAGAAVLGLLSTAATVLSGGAPAAAASVPAAPASCSATWSPGGWAVTWTAPASSGAAPITEYRVNESGDGTPLVKLGSTARTTVWTTPLTFPDRRQFVVRGRNAMGTGATCLATVPVASIPLTVPVGLQPTVSSQKVAESYGVAAHPVYQQSAYQAVDAWMARLADMGVTYFRGSYHPGTQGTEAAVAAARKYHLRWMMLVVDEDTQSPTTQTLAETQDRIKDIASNASDVVYALEGLNEPNHNRGGGAVPSTWAKTATEHQRVIWQTAKSIPALANVPIVGPSLQEINAEKSYGSGSATVDGGPRQYHQLMDAGVTAYEDYAATHSYAGGGLPDNNLDLRLDRMRSAFGAGYPIWIDEAGYHNAVATTGGHRPASEEAAAAYAPRLLMEFAGVRGLHVTRYEALDDVDAGAKDVQEANFGLWRVGSQDPATWTPKPEVAAMHGILSQLADPGAPYTPAPVALGLSGPSDMEYVVTRKRDGSATLWLWRSVSIWDPVARVPLTVPAVPVTVTDGAGVRTVQVAGQVVSVPLR